jgi:hypothetical protein
MNIIGLMFESRPHEADEIVAVEQRCTLVWQPQQNPERPWVAIEMISFHHRT